MPRASLESLLALRSVATVQPDAHLFAVTKYPDSIAVCYRDDAALKQLTESEEVQRENERNRSDEANHRL